MGREARRGQLVLKGLGKESGGGWLSLPSEGDHWGRVGQAGLSADKPLPHVVP